LFSCAKHTRKPVFFRHGEQVENGKCPAKTGSGSIYRANTHKKQICRKQKLPKYRISESVIKGFVN
jgi:hypothetical protein